MPRQEASSPVIYPLKEALILLLKETFIVRLSTCIGGSRHIDQLRVPHGQRYRNPQSRSAIPVSVRPLPSLFAGISSPIVGSSAQLVPRRSRGSFTVPQRTDSLCVGRCFEPPRPRAVSGNPGRFIRTARRGAPVPRRTHHGLRPDWASATRSAHPVGSDLHHAVGRRGLRVAATHARRLLSILPRRAISLVPAIGALALLRLPTGRSVAGIRRTTSRNPSWRSVLAPGSPQLNAGPGATYPDGSAQTR